MKIIAISDFEQCNDPSQVMALFEMGLYRFHIKESQADFQAFIKGIDEKYLSRISFHGDGRASNVESHGKAFAFAKSESCHTIEELNLSVKQYCFLSPIFDSISKKAYPSRFTLSQLENELNVKRASKVFALGGVDNNNIKAIEDIGFHGAAVRGYLWSQGVNSIKQFEKLK
jgi:thiamine-phosphate pyrophosphorylase